MNCCYIVVAVLIVIVQMLKEVGKTGVKERKRMAVRAGTDWIGSQLSYSRGRGERQ